jgi:hypothetical protein
MIILLKIILSLFIIMGVIIARTIYKDFKITKTTQDYEDSILADKIKIKAILYSSIIAICVFCLLLLYYVITPMQITAWF